MKRSRGLLVAGLCCAAVASAVCADDTVQVGSSLADVTSRMGHPTRQIPTVNGVLLFYGPVLVSVERERVNFVSKSELDATLPPPAALAGVTAAMAPTPPAAAEEASPRDWIVEAQARQIAVVAERIRRFLALEVYSQMLSATSRRQYYEGRHWSYTGWGGLDRRLGRAGNQTDDASDGVSFVDLTDAQSVPVSRHGSATAVVDPNVSIRLELARSDGR